jgi:Fungal N-terminal domain of STAND proteins
MDPLSVTASVIAILQLSGKIISACVAYTSSIKDAPRDLRTIIVEIHSLQAVIRVLDLTSIKPTHAENGLAASLDACRLSLKELSDLLDLQTSQSSSGNGQSAKWARLMPTLTTLAWPLKQHRAKSLMDDISRHKSTITLSLSAISR